MAVVCLPFFFFFSYSEMLQLVVFHRDLDVIPCERSIESGAQVGRTHGGRAWIGGSHSRIAVEEKRKESNLVSPTSLVSVASVNELVFQAHMSGGFASVFSFLLTKFMNKGFVTTWMEILNK